MEIVIDKKFKDELSAEALVWIDKIIVLKNNNEDMLSKIESNAKERKRLEKLLYSKYKVRLNSIKQK